MFWYSILLLLIYLILLIIDLFDSILLLYSFSALFFISFSVYDIKNINFILSNSFNPILILLYNLSIINILFKKTHTNIYITKLLSKYNNKSFFTACLLFLTLIFSSIVNNSLVVSSLIPIIINISTKYNWTYKTNLLSTSFISILGGTLTLIGSSTNLLAYTILKPEIKLNMFSLSIYSILTIIPSFIYLYLNSIINIKNSYNLPCFLNKTPELDIKVCCYSIHNSSQLINLSIKHNNIQELNNCQLVAFKKKETYCYLIPRSNYIIEEGDTLVYIGKYKKDNLIDLVNNYGFISINNNIFSPNIAIGTISKFNRYLINKSIIDINFKETYHLILLGIIRNNNIFYKDLKNICFKSNDKLIVSGISGNYEMMMQLNNLCIKTSTIIYNTSYLNTNIINDYSIILFFIILLISGFFSFIDTTLASIIIIYIYYIINIISTSDLIEAFNLQRTVIIGTFCSLIISNCLIESGLINYLGKYISVINNYKDIYIYIILHIFSSILSNLISNSSVITLFIPLIKIAFTGNINLLKISLAVIHGSNCCFISPSGYHTNLMVYNQGGYNCKDFLVLGLPLQILNSFIFCIVLNYI